MTADDVAAFRTALAATFGYDADLEDEGDADRFAAIFDIERLYPAFDGDQVVGTGGDFGFQMTVPGGGQVATTGLTVVTVRPTHTRQGMLTAMMRRHFDLAQERGEILGGLWASEAPIYGRYGYGPSASIVNAKLDVRHSGHGSAEEGVTVRLVEGPEAERLLPAIFDRVQPTRPGMYQRTADWWTHRLFYDPEKYRDGASSMRHAVAESDGEPIGYVSYRQKASWDVLADGQIRIRELMPATDAAYRALWHYLVTIDLFPIVEYWNNPADDPLPFMLRNGRAAETKVSDGLWTRLVNLPAALEARRYQTDGRLTVQVADSFCGWNEGTYLLEVNDGVGQCERVTAESDVSMPSSTLGSLYLGGQGARGLARAGQLRGDVASIQLLDHMFRSYPAPWCPEIF